MAYATRTDLDALGYPSATLAGVSTTIQDDALDAASSHPLFRPLADLAPGDPS